MGEEQTVNIKAIATPNNGVSPLKVQFNVNMNAIRLTINNDGNGTTVPSGILIDDVGDIINISVTPNVNYYFEYWEVVGSSIVDDIYSEDTSVTIVDDTTITAHFISPIMWWKGENNTVDIVSGKDAIWFANPQDKYIVGKVHNAFNAVKVPSDWCPLYVPYDPIYMFDPSGEFSVRFWLSVGIILPQCYFMKSNSRLNGWYYGAQNDWGIGFRTTAVDKVMVTLLTGYKFLDPPPLAVDQFEYFNDIDFGNKIDWHDILWTYNNGTHKIYLDGSLKSTWYNMCKNNLGDTNTELYWLTDGASTNLGCGLDEVKIYDKEITP